MPIRAFTNAISDRTFAQLCRENPELLINPDVKEVEIYRHGRDQEVFDRPSSLSGEELLPGLIVDLADIF